MAQRILILLFCLYWGSCIIVFRKIFKESTPKYFHRKAFKFFIITTILFILAWLLGEGLRNTPLSNTFTLGILHSLIIVFDMGAAIIFIWHVFKGGYLLLFFPFLFLKHGTNGLERIFRKEWELLYGTRRRLMNICLAITIIFIVIPSLFAIVLIVLSYLTPPIRP